jgi:hypothetical protein
MTSIICDGCGKEIVNAQKDRTFITMLDKELCLNCEEKLRLIMRQQTFAHRPIIFKEYQESLSRNLTKLTSRR